MQLDQGDGFNSSQYEQSLQENSLQAISTEEEISYGEHLFHTWINVGDRAFAIPPWVMGSWLCPFQQHIFIHSGLHSLRTSCASYVIVPSSAGVSTHNDVIAWLRRSQKSICYCSLKCGQPWLEQCNSGRGSNSLNSLLAAHYYFTVYSKDSAE